MSDLILGSSPHFETSAFAVAEAAKMANPNIVEVIEYDKDTYFFHETSSGKTAEIGIRAIGATEGCDVIVGAFSFLLLQRKGLRFSEDVFNNPDAFAILPVTTESELERVKDVRARPALFEDQSALNQEYIIQPSIAHLNQYFVRAPGVEVLLRNTEEMIRTALYEEEVRIPIIHNYITGFYHGVRQAIEMYYQSSEQRNLDRVAKAVVYASKITQILNELDIADGTEQQ